MVGKNSQIHLSLETSLKEKLIKEAEEKGICLSELCRQKLKGETQLDRIERMMKKFIELGYP